MIFVNKGFDLSDNTISLAVRGYWISLMQQATPASWMCRRGGMEHGCNFSPFAGKKIYFREILEPLIVKEGISGQAEARIRK